MCLNKLDSEYAWDLNMQKFWLWKGSQYLPFYSVLNIPESALTEFWIYLGLSICQDSQYGWVLNMQELHRILNMPKYSWTCLNRTWICLNMSEFTIRETILSMYHTIRSTRSLYYLMSTYWETGLFRTW